MLSYTTIELSTTIPRATVIPHKLRKLMEIPNAFIQMMLHTILRGIDVPIMIVERVSRKKSRMINIARTIPNTADSMIELIESMTIVLSSSSV